MSMSELRKCGNCLLPETYETLLIEEAGKSSNPRNYQMGYETELHLLAYNHILCFKKIQDISNG